MKTAQLGPYHWQLVKDEPEPYSRYADVLGEALVPNGYVRDGRLNDWFVWSRRLGHSAGKWIKGDALDALAQLAEMVGDEPTNARRGTRSRAGSEGDGRSSPGLDVGTHDEEPGGDDREAGVPA